MPFEAINQSPKTFSKVTEPRYVIIKTPTMTIGRIKVPPAMVTELGWSNGIELQVLAGTGADEGWFQVRPCLLNSTDTRHRARLSIKKNGVGEYATSRLVPAVFHGPISTMSPNYRVEGKALILKLY